MKPATTHQDHRKQLRRILALVMPYSGKIAFCLLLIFAATGIQLSLPLGIRHIFDKMLTSGDVGAIHAVTAALVAVFVLRSVFSFFGQFMLQVTSDRIIVDLRYQLFRHFHALDIGYHHKQRIGDLMSRLSSDVGAIRNLAGNLAVSLIVNVFQLAGAVSLMLWMNWKLGLIVLVVAPLTTLVTSLFRDTFKRISAQIQDEMSQSSIIAQESLSGMEVVKGFARERHEAGRYQGRLMTFMSVVIRARKLDSFFNALLAFIASSSTIAIFWFGGLEVIAGTLTAGTLVAFLLYSQNTTQSIASIAQNYTSYVQALGASSRVFEILDIEPAVRDRQNAAVFADKGAAIDFSGVCFGYHPGVEVLDDIDLRARPGETVALVGPSGSGKSTLLKLVSRYYDPIRGSISINGRDIRDYTLDSLRGAVSVVSQDVFLFGCSVRENIRYGRLDASDAEIEAAARAANAHDFISELPQGYDTQVGERGVQLSGGQRQRISIARALLKNAPILLLDEATSSIDNASERLIQDAIERVKRSRTTLVIAHRLATIRNADQIVLLSGGRIVGRPSYEELVASDEPHVRRLQLGTETEKIVADGPRPVPRPAAAIATAGTP